MCLISHRQTSLQCRVYIINLSYTFQSLRDEIQMKQSSLDKLQSRYEQLGGDHVKTQVEPLRELRQNLIDQANGLLKDREQSLDICRQYHLQQAEMESEIDALGKDLEQLKQSQDISAKEKTERLKVGRIFLYNVVKQNFYFVDVEKKEIST